MIVPQIAPPATLKGRKTRYGIRATPARPGTRARSAAVKRPKNTAKPPRLARYSSARWIRSGLTRRRPGRLASMRRPNSRPTR